MSKQLFQNQYRTDTVRAPWHNYEAGAFFITICTAGRKPYFGRISNQTMYYTEIGNFTKECIAKMETLHPDITVPIFQVMPDHVHAIIHVIGSHVWPHVEPPYYDGPTNTTGSPVEPSHYDGPTNTSGATVEPPHCDGPTNTSGATVEPPHCDGSTTNPNPDSINAHMRNVANHCGRLSHVISRFKSAVTKHAHEYGIPFSWQTRFYDRIIRDRFEWDAIAQYIKDNVANWAVRDENDY